MVASEQVGCCVLITITYLTDVSRKDIMAQQFSTFALFYCPRSMLLSPSYGLLISIRPWSLLLTCTLTLALLLKS